MATEHETTRFTQAHESALEGALKNPVYLVDKDFRKGVEDSVLAAYTEILDMAGVSQTDISTQLEQHRTILGSGKKKLLKYGESTLATLKKLKEAGRRSNRRPYFGFLSSLGETEFLAHSQAVTEIVEQRPPERILRPNKPHRLNPRRG
jgi:hypothetical protein